MLGFSVSLNLNEEQDALLLDGYWVYFGCSEEEPNCTRWGTRKLLGEPAMSELAGGDCNIYATGPSVGFNKVESKLISVCPGYAGQDFRTAEFACYADDSLDNAMTIVGILYHEADLKGAIEDKDAQRIKEVKETINNLRVTLNFPRSRYKEVFKKAVAGCKVVEYNIIESDTDEDFLEGAFRIELE